jgi:ABC-type nitrate/sulfonate/bicarbonate transport system substrate-binding protein
MSYGPSRSAFLAAAGAGLAYAASPSIARAQTTHIDVSAVLSDPFAEPFYAKASGVFAQHGFDIGPTNMFDAGSAIAAIAGGSLQMGMGDLISGVNAIIAGVPIVLIAGGAIYRMGLDEGLGSVAVARTSPIVDAKGLIGATIGVPTLVGETTVFVRSWLAEQGIAASQVRFVEVPPPQVVAGLQRGTIDAGFTGPPFSTFSADTIRSIAFPDNVPAALSPNHQYCNSVWYASKTWIDADLRRARAVVAAIYESARWANSHQDATFKVLIDLAKLDANKVVGMKRVQFATSLNIGMVQPVITLGEREGLLHKPITAAELMPKFL